MFAQIRYIEIVSFDRSCYFTKLSARQTARASQTLYVSKTERVSVEYFRGHHEVTIIAPTHE